MFHSFRRTCLPKNSLDHFLFIKNIKEKLEGSSLANIIRGSDRLIYLMRNHIFTNIGWTTALVCWLCLIGNGNRITKDEITSMIRGSIRLIFTLLEAMRETYRLLTIYLILEDKLKCYERH